MLYHGSGPLRKNNLHKALPGAPCSTAGGPGKLEAPGGGRNSPCGSALTWYARRRYAEERPRKGVEKGVFGVQEGLRRLVVSHCHETGSVKVICWAGVVSCVRKYKSFPAKGLRRARVQKGVFLRDWACAHSPCGLRAFPLGPARIHHGARAHYPWGPRALARRVNWDPTPQQGVRPSVWGERGLWKNFFHKPFGRPGPSVDQRTLISARWRRPDGQASFPCRGSLRDPTL